MSGSARRVAVIGAGWAGLAAAVELVAQGQAVSVFEMAQQPGGRARDLPRREPDDPTLDNGQHILIGAYTETLALMRRVGADPQTLLLRTPLRLGDAAGRGLYLPAGSPLWTFAAAVLARRGWRLDERLALLAAAAAWAARGFRCAEHRTVGELTARLPAAVRRDLIDPLCVAALNTPAAEASGRVFLRVLRDSLFAGTGSADLLLPRVGLGDLLPRPAWRWLAAQGAVLRAGRRVQALSPEGKGWRVDGEHFDGVVLATPPGEAARLAEAHAPGWAAQAAAFVYEPIATVYVQADDRLQLPEAMLALESDDRTQPAQFVFDRGQLGGPPGLLAFVISGAARWVDLGTAATEAATLNQARMQLGDRLTGQLTVLRTVTEKRATFRCTPALCRPGMDIAPGLWAAGDHVDGPYPATLEGAVRSGHRAARQFGDPKRL